MASYRGLKQVGEGLLDYMMKHRPEVDEDMSAGLHDLEELFPGIYGKRAGAYSTRSGADVDSEAMAAINAAQGNPDAEVDIFRAVPQGVRDFNVGDWVTTSKSYAHEHGGHALNGDYDIITGKAKASDLYNPGDSIAEMGYWGLPMAGKVTRGIIPAVGAGGLLALMGPEEAEAATRPDYAKRILEKHEKGSKSNIESGTLEPYLYDQVKKQSPHAVNEVLSSAHAIKQRMKKPGWSPAHTIQRVSEVMDSKKDGLVVKNWQEDTGAEDYAKHGILMPYKEEPTFTPYIVDKKGKIVFKTILPPTRGQLAKVNVGVEGGVPLISRELTDAEVKPSAQRLPVSVVTPTTGVIMPESLTRSNRKDGDFWPSMARQFGLGTRGVIEGLGTGATLGFGDPGRVIADFIGLPVPETDIERQRVGLNAGVTDALTTFAGGVGAAKMAASPVVRGVGMELADKPLLGAGIGGLLGLLTYDEED